jgi:tRNA(Ile)-lysidine synthase
VATGHTLDDQAETVLYRFLRGAGTAGLSGIRVATESGIIRPLIEIGRDEIRQWLKDRAIAWREDASNRDLEFARNRLRFEIIPRLEAAVNPAVSQMLAQTASWAAAEEDYWNAEMERLAPLYLDQSQPEIVLIRTEPFLSLPIAVQRRLLRVGVEKLRDSLRSIDFGHIEAIRALMSTREGSGRLQIPDLDIYRSFDWLRLGPVGYDRRLERDFEVPLAVPGITTVPGRPITVETELVGFPHVYNEELEYSGGSYIDAGRSGSWVLRNWRPGDRYQVQGRADAEKIKSLFQEFRVPLWERRNWPVIVLNGDIVWSRKFGVAREFAAGPRSQRIVGIREWKESNPQARTSTN